MSLLYTVDVQCDHDEGLPTACHTWTHGEVSLGSPNAAAAQRRARSLGWVRKNGKHYCPDHAALAAREPESEETSDG